MCECVEENGVLDQLSKMVALKSFSYICPEHMRGNAYVT
jgi:hypothetical protein